MKAIKAAIFISIFVIGIGHPAKAQTTHKTENKIEVEHKIKEEPAIVKEPEAKSESHTEMSLPSTPEHKEVAREREETKPVNTVPENNTTPVQTTSKSSPLFNQMGKASLKSAPRVKTFVLATDSTKK